MRAGKLDRVIIIQRGATVNGAGGVPVTTWSPIGTMRAQIVNGATEEFIRGPGASEETSITFRLRFLDGVTTENRVTFEGQAFDIKEIRELGRRRGLDIRCVRVAP
jgi:SPP1 family predicted phage head-tail adaptor